MASRRAMTKTTSNRPDLMAEAEVPSTSSIAPVKTAAAQEQQANGHHHQIRRLRYLGTIETLHIAG